MEEEKKPLTFKQTVEIQGLRDAARFRMAETVAAVQTHGWPDNTVLAMLALHGLNLTAAVILSFERGPEKHSRDFLKETMTALLEECIEELEREREADGNSDSTNSGSTGQQQAD